MQVLKKRGGKRVLTGHIYVLVVHIIKTNILRVVIDGLGKVR